MSALLSDVRVVARWLVRIAREAPALTAWIVIGSVVTAALLVSFPWLWQLAIDAIREPGHVGAGELAAWMLAAGLGHVLSFLLLQAARARGNAVVSGHARQALVRAVVHADPPSLRGWRTGDLVARLHDDAGDKIGWFLCSGVYRAWEAALVAGGCFALMMASEPALAVWVVAPLPVLLLAQAVGQRIMAALQARVQAAQSDVSEEITSTFGSLRVVQAAGLEQAVTDAFRAASERQRDAEVRAAAAESAVALLYAYGWQLSLAALLLFGGLQVMDGTLSLGRYVAFEGLLTTMVWPMLDLGVLLSKLPLAAVSLRRIEEVLDLPEAPSPRVDHADGPLRVQGLAVLDEDGVPRLDGVDLQVAPGSRIAVVGGVGAGKSVLVDALTGLRGHAGFVGLGDTSLHDLPAGGGGRLAVVPQDVPLVGGTLRENVLLGRDVPDAALVRALAVSQLDVDLPALSDGLETRVGERGVTLSGGQRQRVGLARALVGRPDLLLLDDATSALDAEVEASLWAALSRDEPGLGVLLVTHRTGTLSGVDEVVVLEGGRVVQRGTHASLLAVDGAYRRLYGPRGQANASPSAG